MKRKLFIGSSREGQSIAKKLQTKILEECGEWIEPKIWADKGVFLLNSSTFHSLIESSRKYEYGIFVATADDILEKREEKSKTMRDNVLFEAGMFLGSLGLTRAFILVEDGCNLPTDYLGVTVPFYNSSNLDEKMSEIITEIKKTQHSYKFNIIPSTALAIGYFENFIKPFAEKQKDKFVLKVLIPKNISDIPNLVKLHIRETQSNEIGERRPFTYQYPSKELWDIPTNLTTLKTVIDTIAPRAEIGLNAEKNEWIQHEIRNFMGTLQFLVSENCITNSSVVIEYFDFKL